MWLAASWGRVKLQGGENSFQAESRFPCQGKWRQNPEHSWGAEEGPLASPRGWWPDGASTEPGAWGTRLTEPVRVPVKPRTSPAPPRPQRTPAPELPGPPGELHRPPSPLPVQQHPQQTQTQVQGKFIGTQGHTPAAPAWPDPARPPGHSAPSPPAATSPLQHLPHTVPRAQQSPGVTPSQLGPVTDSRARAGDSHGWEDDRASTTSALPPLGVPGIPGKAGADSSSQGGEEAAHPQGQGEGRAPSLLGDRRAELSPGPAGGIPQPVL